MQIEQYLELVRNRRSIRRFKSDPVPDDAIMKILEAGRWAQSGANGQPWEYIVVKNKTTIRKIAEMSAEHRKTSWAVEKTRIPEIRHRAGMKEPGNELPAFVDAPVLIVLIGDPRTTQASVLVAQFLPNEGGFGAHFLKNMANTTQLMTLAASALGLGSQWVSVNYHYEARLKALLEIPDHFIVHTMLPIGYPAHRPPPGYRRALTEIAHFEKYDQSKCRSAEDIYQFLLMLRRRTQSAYQISKDDEIAEAGTQGKL